MAREVGVDATGGPGAGFLVRGAGSLEQRRANTRETVGLPHRHGGFPRLEARAGSGSCLLSSLLSWAHGLKATAEEQWPHAKFFAPVQRNGLASAGPDGRRGCPG